MVCNGFLHQLHVVCRRVDERRARRPTKIAGVCGFSAVAIFMEGCRLFQKRPKNRITHGNVRAYGIYFFLLFAFTASVSTM